MGIELEVVVELRVVGKWINLRETEESGGGLVGLDIVVDGIVTVIVIGDIVEGIVGGVGGNVWTVIFEVKTGGITVLIVVILVTVTLLYSLIGVVELFKTSDSLIIFEGKVIFDTVAFEMIFMTVVAVTLIGVTVVLVKYNLETSSNGLTVN